MTANVIPGREANRATVHSRGNRQEGRFPGTGYRATPIVVPNSNSQARVPQNIRPTHVSRPVVRNDSRRRNDAVYVRDQRPVRSGYMTTPSFRNLEYVPFLGTVLGVCRAVFGIFQLLTAAFSMPFRSDRAAYRHNFSQGIYNVVRGTVAMVPVIGGVALCVYDHR